MLEGIKINLFIRKRPIRRGVVRVFDKFNTDFVGRQVLIDRFPLGVVLTDYADFDDFNVRGFLVAATG